MNIRIPLFLVSLSLSLSWPVQAAPNFKEGLWEITSKSEMPGMPMQMPPHTHRQCMSNKEPIPQQPDQGNCKMDSVKMEGDTVTWSGSCKGREGTSKLSGRITYSGTSFAGEMKMTMQRGRETYNMTSKMQGKRIGDCKK
jgi:hypothetical protein